MAIARKNAKIHLLKDRCQFITSNLFSGLTKYVDFFDLIITNPPYIETAKITTLQAEVQNFEPFLALVGKEDGLYFYQQIAKLASDFLTSKGHLFTEIGYQQAKSVLEIFQQSGKWQHINNYNDLSGITRVLQFQKI